MSDRQNVSPEASERSSAGCRGQMFGERTMFFLAGPIFGRATVLCQASLMGLLLSLFLSPSGSTRSSVFATDVAGDAAMKSDDLPTLINSVVTRQRAGR